MTIAVIAPWPWGKMKYALPPGAWWQREAVIIAADTRFSNDKRVMDRGRKIFPLVPNMAVVYTGRTWTAQRAIQDLMRILARCAAKNIGIGERTVGAFLEAAHDKQLKPIDRRRKPNGLSLRFLGSTSATMP